MQCLPAGLTVCDALDAKLPEVHDVARQGARLVLGLPRNPQIRALFFKSIPQIFINGVPYWGILNQ